jgi:hypothetical protein
MGDRDKDPVPADAIAAAFRAALDQVAAMFRPVLESAVDVRAAFLEAGFSDKSADMMAAEYYRGALSIVIKQISGR